MLLSINKHLLTDSYYFYFDRFSHFLAITGIVSKDFKKTLYLMPHLQDNNFIRNCVTNRKYAFEII